MELNKPITRIIARYGAGAMTALGIMSLDFAQEFFNDADVMLIIGAAVGVITEFAYSFAKKVGGPT